VLSLLRRFADGFGPSNQSGPVKRPSAWQEAEVIEVIEEAPDAVTLRLHLAPSAGFLPGQYDNVRLDIADRLRPVQRACSVDSSPLPDPLRIDLGVRAVPGGLISPRLVRELTVGQLIEVRGPVGRFSWTGEDGQPVFLVRAGSSLVPLMAMVRYAVAVGRAVRVCLVCSAVTYEHAVYREELAHLSRRHDWLRAVHCITRDAGEARAAYHRRIDRDLLAEVLDGEIPAQAHVCGPPVMVSTAEAALADLSVETSRIRSEKYD
jgi:ferredoxin-NADP reductase